MEKTTVMDRFPLVKKLLANPKLQRLEDGYLTPNWDDREVRKAIGRTGHSYVNEFPKHGHLQFWEEETKKMHCAVYFSTLTEGPPGCAHGGSIAASFDHLLGNFVFRACGVQYHTVNLSIDYKKFVRLDSVVKVVLEVTKMEGRKVFVKGTMTDEDEQVVHAIATGVFLRHKDFALDYDELRELMKGRTKEDIINRPVAKI